MGSTAEKNSRPTLSVVTSLYHSEAYVDEFYSRMKGALTTITDDYEIIFVDDGSPDQSLQVARQIQMQDPRVIVIELTRNFGQHKANMTGLEMASGDLVFLIEADLEESPEWVVDFYHGLKDHDDVDVVFGLQKRRKGGRVERISGSLFYKIFNLFSDVKIPENHITARLMKRSYVLSLIQYRERSLFIGGVYELAGSRQMPMVVTKLSQSPTTYSPFRKLNLLVNAITSFSTFPLWLIFWLGFSISLFSFSMILYVIAKWYFVSIQPGWTSLIASIWAVGGLIMLSLGVIGIYTKKIIEEANNRPFTTIRNIYRNGRG